MSSLSCIEFANISKLRGRINTLGERKVWRVREEIGELNWDSCEVLALVQNQSSKHEVGIGIYVA